MQAAPVAGTLSAASEGCADCIPPVCIENQLQGNRPSAMDLDVTGPSRLCPSADQAAFLRLPMATTTRAFSGAMACSVSLNDVSAKVFASAAALLIEATPSVL